jgi:hypothetical protein
MRHNLNQSKRYKLDRLVALGSYGFPSKVETIEFT